MSVKLRIRRVSPCNARKLTNCLVCSTQRLGGVWCILHLHACKSCKFIVCICHLLIAYLQLIVCTQHAFANAITSVNGIVIPTDETVALVVQLLAYLLAYVRRYPLCFKWSKLSLGEIDMHE